MCIYRYKTISTPQNIITHINQSTLNLFTKPMPQAVSETVFGQTLERSLIY